MKRDVAVSKPIISNCLISAIFAKLKDWKNVKIFRVPKKFNMDRGVHYYWSKVNENGILKYYEFIPNVDHVLHYFPFRGRIYESSKERMEYKRNLCLKYYLAKHVEKKFNLKTWHTSYYEMRDCNTLFFSVDLKPKLLGSEYSHKIICRVRGADGEIFQKAYSYDTNGIIMNPNNDEILEWRYVDDDFDWTFYEYERGN